MSRNNPNILPKSRDTEQIQKKINLHFYKKMIITIK